MKEQFSQRKPGKKLSTGTPSKEDIVQFMSQALVINPVPEYTKEEIEHARREQKRRSEIPDKSNKSTLP